MTPTPPLAAPLPDGARRLVIFVVYDRRGEVGDYILHALRGLRPHATRILAVVNGAVSSRGRAELESVVDEVLVRSNQGFDVEAQREALAYLGDDLRDYDELVLTNDTWYGPVHPFADVFSRMARRALHIWGMTEHPRAEGDPAGGREPVPWHLQSYWLAVRRSVFLSDAWSRYWHQLAPIVTYDDAVRHHELVFAEWFQTEGFVVETAFPSAEYSGDNPAIFHADLLLRDGCPLLKRRLFFHHPTFMIRYAVIARDVLRLAGEYGYPVELVYQDLARNVAPRTLHSALASLQVRFDSDPRVEGSAVVYIESVRPRSLADVARAVAMFPADTPLVLVAAAHEDPDEISAAWSAVDPVRAPEVAPSASRGTVLRAAIDRARSGYDLFVHIDATLWDAGEADRRFLREHQWGALWSPSDPLGFIVALLRRRPEAGLLLPPEALAGVLPAAVDWQQHREHVRRAASHLDISVPTDEFGPLAPTGGLWVARPDALDVVARMVGDPDVAPAAQRLLLAQAVGEAGFITLTVTDPPRAARSHTSVEYALDRLLETTRGSRFEQIQFLQRIGWRGRTRQLDVVRMMARARAHPALSFVRALARRTRRGGRGESS